MAPLKESPRDPSADIATPPDNPEIIVIDDDIPAGHHNPSDAEKNSCKSSILAVFPDICSEYLDRVTSEYTYNTDTIITVILDNLENGKQYPVRSRENPRKRKREDQDGDQDNGQEEDDEGGEAITRKIRDRISDPENLRQRQHEDYKQMARKLIAQEGATIDNS
ncbi:hypothetical protein AAE478_000517 [Parahypoxylon ruwenzoriense]